MEAIQTKHSAWPKSSPRDGNVMVEGVYRLIAISDSKGRQAVDVPRGIYYFVKRRDGYATLTGPGQVDTVYTLHDGLFPMVFDDYRITLWP